MSNPHFNRVIAPQEYEIINFPREILYDNSLSGNSLKLLLIMLDYGKRRNWQLRQTHLMNESGFGHEKYDNAMKNLISSGYVHRSLTRKSGKFSEYIYKFSSFPIFKNQSSEDECPHIESEPFRVSRTGESDPDNPILTSRDNLHQDRTTNYPDSESTEENLVSSSFEVEKLQELENISDISPSQKKTLYRKFTHDQIIKSIKSLDLERAKSPFALIYASLKNGWDLNETKYEKIKEAKHIFNEASKFLMNLKSCNISIEIDEENAYIFYGTATSAFALDSEDFKQKFCDSFNKLRK